MPHNQASKMPEQLERTSIGAVRPRLREDIGAYLPSIVVREEIDRLADWLSRERGPGSDAPLIAHEPHPIAAGKSVFRSECAHFTARRSSPRYARARNAWVVDQLFGIQHFLEVARKYGFAVTATPQGRALLDASKHPDVVFVRDTVCPVETDPWSQARR
jgi:hypothetical protein